MPYRYIFAIATEDSVYFYETQNLTPFAFVTGIHYSNLSDLSWSYNGRILNITSIDGFSSFVIFNEKELGEIFVEEDSIAMETETKTDTKPDQVSILFNTKKEELKKDDKVLSEMIVLENKVENDSKKLNSKRIKLIPLA